MELKVSEWACPSGPPEVAAVTHACLLLYTPIDLNLCLLFEDLQIEAPPLSNIMEY